MDVVPSIGIGSGLLHGNKETKSYRTGTRFTCSVSSWYSPPVLYISHAYVHDMLLYTYIHAYVDLDLSLSVYIYTSTCYVCIYRWDADRDSVRAGAFFYRLVYIYAIKLYQIYMYIICYNIHSYIHTYAYRSISVGLALGLTAAIQTEAPAEQLQFLTN